MLSACANALIVNEHVVRSDGDLFVKESARQGQMQTVVMGTDFGEDSPTIIGAVTDAMPGTYRGPEMEFTPLPNSNRLDVRAVFVLNAKRGQDIKALCASADGFELNNPTDGMRIVGALCKGPQTVRYATARGVKPSSLQDPLFRNYIAAITSHLLSLRNTDKGGCDNSPCSGS